MVRPGDEVSLRIPPGNIGVSIIKTEEQKLLRLASIFRSDGEPATSFGDVVLEKVLMQDAAVDDGNGNFLIVVAAVSADKVPSLAGNIFVDAGNWRIPVFFSADGSLDALPTLKPVRRAKDGAQAEE